MTRRVMVMMATVALVACGGQKPAPKAAPRPARSAAANDTLATAIRDRKPEFATQDDALRSGVYKSAGAPPPAATVVVLPVTVPVSLPVPVATSGATQSGVVEIKPGEWLVQVAAYDGEAAARAGFASAKHAVADLNWLVIGRDALFKLGVVVTDQESALRLKDRLAPNYPGTWTRQIDEKDRVVEK